MTRVKTGGVAAQRPGPRVARTAPRNLTLLLMLPAVAMLTVMFLVPLILFFVRTFMEFDGTSGEFVAQAEDLLLSQAFLTALGTTNWISLIVTVVVLLIGYPDRLLSDNGDMAPASASSWCRSSCRISPASSCAPIPGWCCWASMGWSTQCCWRRA